MLFRSFHYAGLLIDLDRFDELKKLLQKCLKVVTVDKAWVYYRYAMIEEINGNYSGAIQQYKTAILHCLNNDKIKDYQTDIERCKTKEEIAKEEQEVKQ